MFHVLRIMYYPFVLFNIKLENYNREIYDLRLVVRRFINIFGSSNKFVPY